MIPDPKGAQQAGREGVDLTFEKLNPFKKPASEKFDQFGKNTSKKKVKKK
jgi:hypothetical protein